MEKFERNLTLNEKDLKQALESKDKNVVIDFALQYKWERDYLQREKEKAEKECYKVEKALDILASMFVRERSYDSDSKEERRKAKVHLVMFAKEVADYMLNGSFENDDETEI